MVQDGFVALIRSRQNLYVIIVIVRKVRAHLTYGIRLVFGIKTSKTNPVGPSYHGPVLGLTLKKN